MDPEDMSEQIPAARRQPLFLNQNLSVTHQELATQQFISDIVVTEDGLSNGTCEVETLVALQCPGDRGDIFAESGHQAVKSHDPSEFSNSNLPLPEVCISTNSNSCEEDEMNHEVQQAYRIFTGFLLDKHKGITRPFLNPIGHQEAQRGIGEVQGRGQAQLKQSMCLRRMEEKFIGQEYETITEFVADFRLMLENCYRYHGVDHWISKQAQKLEVMLEQKLTLLSRTLREKTTLAVTSKGRFGAEEDRGSGGTSTRRRLAPRTLATITVGGQESVMVQALRLEEQQRAKEEKRQRELEKKEAVEMSAKEVEEWEQTLLSQASPHTVDTLWELPAIGHFLCLAQTALNLPEIVFFELERCLLMPRCSLLLSKIMSSLLSPPQRRATLQRRPPLSYRRWESELRQRVLAWYRCVGASQDQLGRAEHLGLCHQFFSCLGEVSPLEEKPFHLLPFYQRVWLLKGLCDHVYETQKGLQDAVLAQPIHECRESILGYDSKENAYIHFPHFCGADLRIYCQSPSTPPAFPFPSVLVKRVEVQQGLKGDELDRRMAERIKCDIECYEGSLDKEDFDFHDFGRCRTDALGIFKRENGAEDKMLKLWSLKKEQSESGSSDRESSEEADIALNTHNNSLPISHTSLTGRTGTKVTLKEETVKFTVKKELDFSISLSHTIKTETQEPSLSVGEHSYTGRSPARSVSLLSSTKPVGLNMESPNRGQQSASCLECFKNTSKGHNCCCGTSTSPVSPKSTGNVSDERTYDVIWTKKKKRKKKRGGEQLPRVKGRHKQPQNVDRMKPSTADRTKTALRGVAATVNRKDKKKRHKTEKKLEASKKMTEELPVEPSFKLVCRNLDELRGLISKTEDELDDLESTKKRLGRWYHKRESVKELHSTLIRLLNELLPWEPKLVKAYQRNRLRLKKEFDDFKKHPEYNNFVREECISSSSSDEDDEKGLGKDMLSVTDHYRRSEDEDMEHIVPRGLWSGARNGDFGVDPAGEATTTSFPPIHLKHPSTSTGNGFNLMPKAHTGTMSCALECGPQARSEAISSDQSMDSNSSWASELHVQTSLSPKPTILHPTTGLPKGYTPIPVLLAKSVGNKVTLMKRPVDCAGFNSVDGQRKGTSVSPPFAAIINPKLSKAQTSLSSSLRSSQQMQAQELPQAHGHLGMTTVTATLGVSPQTNPSQTAPTRPVQDACKTPQGPGQDEEKDNSGPVKLAVHPVTNHNTGEKVMRKVVILTSLNQQQSKDKQVPVSKVVTPLCLATSVPGFIIPENRIPVQPVAPLKDSRTVSKISPSVSTCQQQGTLAPASFKTVPISSPQTSTPQNVTQSLTHITSPSRTVSTEPIRFTDAKQELKTMCIRDSQSILVTTRGGNTGIVKVQTSSDHGLGGSLSSSPIITISPQFKAFLVSKTATTLSPLSPSQTFPCTIPTVTSASVAQPQKQGSSAVKTLAPLKTPLHSAVTGSMPITGPVGHTPIYTPLNQGSYTSASSTVSKGAGNLVPISSAGPSHHSAPFVPNMLAVPSQSHSGASQAVAQSDVTKTGVKRANMDERSQITKFILVSPPSTPTSSAAISKGTSPSKQTLPNSRVVFIGQTTATSSASSIGSMPKQPIVTASGQLLTASLLSQNLKMGISSDQSKGCSNSEAVTKIENISLPSGVPIQLAGKTTTIGQTIGVLSCSPSKSSPVTASDSGSLAAIKPGLIIVSNSNTITTCSTQLASHTPPTTQSSQCTPSNGMISQIGAATSIVNTLPAENKVRKHFDIRSSEPCSRTQATTTVQSNPLQRSTTILQPKSNIKNGIVKETSFPSPFQVPFNKSTFETTSTPFSTSTTGTIQQRIVLNTSTPLAAGTQIILNNTRFVVPPQGLGPGSHVLVISSPAPQQVPTVSITSSITPEAPQAANPAVVAPRASVLSQSQAKSSVVPAASSTFVGCTSAVGPSLITNTPNVTPSQITGILDQGSAGVPSKTMVSTLSAFGASQTGPFAPPAVGTASVGAVPAFFSPAATSAVAFGSSQAPIRLAAATAMQVGGSSTILPVGAHPSPRLSTPLSPILVLPSPATVSLSSPVKPVPSLITSAAVPPLPSTVTQHRVFAPGHERKPQQTAVKISAPSAALSQALLHTGQGNTIINKHVPVVMQPLLSDSLTQALPTMAVPPIVSMVSRMQTLPVATVQPIGSTIKTFGTAPVGTTPSSSSTVIMTPPQPMSSLRPNSAIHTPVILTNQTSMLGIHSNVASKLLVSPDGAVLSTAQCQVTPAELTTCPKPTEALVVSTNSSTGVLYAHDSSSQANIK